MLELRWVTLPVRIGTSRSQSPGMGAGEGANAGPRGDKREVVIERGGAVAVGLGRSSDLVCRAGLHPCGNPGCRR